MSTTNPLTLQSVAILFVDNFEQAEAIVKRQAAVKEFFILGDNNKRPSKAVAETFKARNARLFRIRPAGSWNSLFRAMNDVEQARADNAGYSEVQDLMFISLLPATDIDAALRRHRAVNNLSCREAYFLETLDLPETADDGIYLALKGMPTVAAPVYYSALTMQQRFDLSAFEFPRFTRPIHCVQSVTNILDGVPFYTSRSTILQPGQRVNVGTIGHMDHSPA